MREKGRGNNLPQGGYKRRRNGRGDRKTNPVSEGIIGRCRENSTMKGKWGGSGDGWGGGEESWGGGVSSLPESERSDIRREPRRNQG